MKTFSRLTFLTLVTVFLIVSCKQEEQTNFTTLSAQYTDLTLEDEFDLPDPLSSEQYAVRLFDLKEEGSGLTKAELLSIGDPSTNPDLLYALLFVETYDRDQILWSWDEPAMPEEDLEDRSHTGKWKWTADPPMASFSCPGHLKYPAYIVKNRFTDPCGEIRKAGPIYTCCFKLCDNVKPLECQSGCEPEVIIPAGSTDALADALEEVCSSGTIIYAEGEHTQTDGVVIRKKVTIKGEDGAILHLSSDIDLMDGTPLDAGLHFYGAYGAKLENLEIVAAGGVAGTCILIEDSRLAEVRDCEIKDFQYGVLVQESEKVTVSGNTIATNLGWTAGDFPSAFGVVIINGKDATIRENDISQSVFGVWACDKDGLYEDNYTHHNFIGFILCKVPIAMKMPFDDQPTGARFSATNWTVRNNNSQYNEWGYLSIDGANHNTLTNNEGGNNAVYDMELAGGSERFGFFTPECSNETVNTGSFNITIKDCGTGNVINGTYTPVDTGVDPCF